jgi:hypothetical protein
MLPSTRRYRLNDTALRVLALLLPFLAFLAVMVVVHIRLARLRAWKREHPGLAPPRREVVLTILWMPVLLAIGIPVFAIAGRWDMVVACVLCLAVFAFLLYRIAAGRYDRRGE